MTRPQRFCMVTTFYPPHHFGGDAMYVQRLSRELVRRGHDVTVVYPPDAYDALGGRTQSAPSDDGVHVVPLDGKLGAVAPTLTYLTGRPALRSRQLRTLLEGESFDVVHFHNVSLVGGPAVLGYGSATKLYTAHEHWLVCPMHVLWRMNREPCERPTCLRCTLAFRRPPQLWRYTNLLERSAEHVDAFLSPSRFTARMHAERGFARALRHLPHFVPSSEADVPPSARERPYFLVVARLERLKGVQTLIDAFRRYDAADLLVVGEGTYAADLRRQAAGLGRVHFLGRREFDELRPLFVGAVATLQPSIGYETFGITAIESFAHGTPAIVRNLGALPETIEDSGAGFVYRTNDELIEAMERLRVDPALRSELGERGRRAHRALWSERPHLDRYLAIVEECAGNKSRNP